MRVIVVGGGVIGLLAALACIEAGALVTVVDQATIPFSYAASHDRHRIVRALHHGELGMTRAAIEAQRLWLALERLLGIRCYERSGALTVLPESAASAACESMAAAGARARLVPGDELRRRYGHIRFPPGSAAVLELDAGVVLADRVLRAATRRLAGEPRARLLARRPVVGVDAASVSIRLAGGAALYGDQIILAAGAWSRRLLPRQVAASLTLYRQSMLYCRVPEARRAVWSATPAVPVLGTSQGAWLVPPVASTPLKISAHSACRAVPELTNHDTPGRWRDHLVDMFYGLLVGFQPGWVVGSRDCYYLAHSTTGGPLLTTWGAGTVWAYAACGGSSFKFAPLIAQSLSQRVIGASPAPTGLQTLDHPWPVAADTWGEVVHDR